VEQRKKGYQEELDSIKSEEHDVGLKLHRAWKKREREEGGSGSALWVRRVTGWEALVLQKKWETRPWRPSQRKVAQNYS
jgi:hypothetical protein